MTRYRLKLNGQPEAWTEGPNALADILHYATVYSQDGPVQIEIYENKRWKKWKLG